MTMTIPAIVFGTELRRQRLEAGLSLTELARLVHYSKGHLSKVETGAKPPSADLIRQCDAVLSSGGTLLARAPSPRRDTSAAMDDEADEVWIMKLDPGGNESVGAITRRSLLAAGAAGMATWMAPSPASPGDAPRQRSGSAVATFRVIFDNVRQLGQWIRPTLLLPQLGAQIHALQTLAVSGHPDDRDAALVLASRFAEYAGWLSQETGEDPRAAWWTERAVELATAGGNRDMQAYALVRRGLSALYRDDAAATVALAQAAQSATADPRVQGLAAQREAQGHALDGDYDACMRALDRARERLSVAEVGTEPIIGSSQVGDIAEMATGWCLLDLGRPRDAAQVLARELELIPSPAWRAHARYGTRLALAYAAAGEPELAASTVAPVLDAMGHIESATVRIELRRLARALNRWHGLTAIRETRLRLTNSLNAETYQ